MNVRTVINNMDEGSLFYPSRIYLNRTAAVLEHLLGYVQYTRNV